MKNMRFKVGDRVKVKSLQWFNENCNDDFNVVFANGWYFSEPMSIFCGKELTIEKISHATNPPHYIMKDNMFAWTDEMIEGLVEEGVNIDVAVEKTTKDISDKVVDTLMGGLMVGKSFNLPDGYIFKDENGNVINATKIVLEKKKKEYPKTYEECCEVLGLNSEITESELLFYYPLKCGDYTTIRLPEMEKFEKFIQLYLCRNAYWKIAGEEMGLGKPWEPDWNDVSDKYCIYFVCGDAWSKECQTRQVPFAFPTPEMRDAFKENFDKDLEFCKELL